MQWRIRNEGPRMPTIYAYAYIIHTHHEEIRALTCVVISRTPCTVCVHSIRIIYNIYVAYTAGMPTICGVCACVCACDARVCVCASFIGYYFICHFLYMSDII